MSKREKIGIMIIFGILAGNETIHSQDTENADGHHHWSYSGKEGPGKWASLEPDFFECKDGQHQSPINIHTLAATKSDLSKLEFHYNLTPPTIIDNGHTIEITSPPGNTLTIDGKSYELKQFHFHHPSEEHIDGHRFDMVAHLVHEDAAENIVVVAVLLKAGGANSLIDTIWKNTPATKQKPLTPPGVFIDLNKLLPNSLGYYTFPGSLTTPPCTEIVTWYVLKTPEEISTAQVETFAKIYPRDARPIQPLHHRTVTQTPY